MSSDDKSLYPQSQQEIVPIVDVIPIENGMIQPASLKWQIKHPLDHSETHHQGQQISPVNVRTHTMESQLTSEPKTTSIMREGFSLNTLPEKHPNLYQKYKLNRQYRLNPLATELHLHHPPAVRSRKSTEPRQRTEQSRAPSIKARYASRNSLQRSSILNAVLRDVQESQNFLKSGTMVGHLRRKKERILGEIQQRLEINRKLSVERSLLVKPTPVDQNNLQCGLRQSKNILKSAVRSSNQSSVRTSSMMDRQPTTNQPSGTFNLSVPLTNSSNYLRTTPDSQIFTFSTMKNGVPLNPMTVFGHVKQVSIEVESGGQINSNGQLANNQPIKDCTLCQIKGMRCSFH